MSDLPLEKEKVPPQMARAPLPTSEALVAAVCAALSWRADNVPNKKAWIGRCSTEMDMPTRTFERALYGEGEISALHMERLRWYFGPGFSSEIGLLTGQESAWCHTTTAVQEGNRLEVLEKFLSAVGAYSDELRDLRTDFDERRKA